jgi:hypothetical protein
VVAHTGHTAACANMCACRLRFLSRYEESDEQKKVAETYRLVATTEDTFLAFVKAWAMWISKFNRNTDLVEAA